MANFDLDDPLGDLLSEGSNDSFFEEPKVLAKRSSLTKTPEKKTISDLFSLSNQDDTKESKAKDDWLGLSEGAELPPQKHASIKATKKISFDDKDDNDIFSSLGIDKISGDDVKPKINESKKPSLMESIFGTSTAKVQEKNTFEDILKESKKIAEDVVQTVPPPKAETAAQLQETSKYEFTSLDSQREGRRGGRRQSGGLYDPLGLFESETKKADLKSSTSRNLEILPSKSSTEQLTDTAREPVQVEVPQTEILYNSNIDMKTKSAPNLTNVPNWLGGSGAVVKAHKSEAGINNTAIESQAETIRDSQLDLRSELHSLPSTLDPSTKQMMESLLTQQKLTSTQLGYQNTSLALQQQESQLIMALQLRKYEENLAEMQKQQQDLLVKQEQQFNSLLDRQFTKQQVIENNMRLQQERINSHIQMLLSQPSFGEHGSGDITKSSELQKANTEEISTLYEKMIATLKQHQQEELFLLEESYKKQIATLESMSESVETRLKEEIKSLVEKNDQKLKSISSEHEIEVQKYKAHIEDLNEQHKNDLRQLKDNQNVLIEDIKQEYSTMLESIKQSKKLENSLYEYIPSYSEKLDVSLKMMDINSKGILELKEKVESDYGILSKAREESLKVKEEEIKLMRQALEKAREIAETERSQLMGLVRTLETKLAEQSQNAREERWALQQATITLSAKAAALDREVEYTRASLEQERSQIKTLKENLLGEQERVLLQLTEEKLAVSAEKSRLETLSKLQNNYDSQKARTEIDAAVQVAQTAAAETYKEKELLHQQKIEMDKLKRQLEEKERHLYAQEVNLESLIKNAERKALEGEKALNEAKNLENTYNSQLKDIQRQLSTLSVREKKLAEEKISLSKERIALHNASRLNKKCSFCSIEVPSKLYNESNKFDNDFELSSPQFANITDPEILKLRFDLDNDNFQDIS